MTARPTEQIHPDGPGLHTRAADQVLAQALAAQAGAVARLEQALPALSRAARAAAEALNKGGRVAYAGAGSSGLMALADALELSGHFNIPPERTPVLFAGGAAALLHLTGGVEDDAQAGANEAAALRFGPTDALIAVSASGGTPYTVAAARTARAAGAAVIGIASVPDSPLIDMASHPVILDSGPEIIAGATRLGAATVQKIAVNLISVWMGIATGAVHDGRLIDLIADNAKLARRAVAIIATIAGCDEDAAQEALDRCGGRVKPAILVARGLSPDQAAAALQTSRGHLAPALEQL